MKPWLRFLIVFLVGFIVFFPTFKLSLFGDDWLVFWRYGSFFPPSQISNVSDYVKHFLTRYGSQDILLGFLRSIYGYQSEYYYLTSFVMRTLAAFSLYPLTLYLTKNKLATFFAMLFFSVTTIGLESTEYIAHIPSYIGLTFFNLFLYYFLSSREKSKGKKLLFSGLFFYLTFIIVPIRMTGLLPFILFIEIFWIVQNFNKRDVFRSVKRLSFILLIFLFINISGSPFFFPSQGRNIQPTSNIFLINQTTDSLFNILKQLENHRFDFLFYPIISFGNMFIPDTVINNFSTALSIPRMLLLVLLIYSLFIIITKVFVTKTGSFKRILFLTILWSFISSIIFLANQTTFPNPKFFILLIIGGYAVIIGIYLLYKFYHDNLASQALFSSLTWSFASFLVPWLWDPTFLLTTYHRYLIGSAVGISLFLSTIISLAKDMKYQKAVLASLVVLLFIHIQASSNYISTLVNNHNQQISNKIWAAMPYISQVGKSTEPLVFYFEGDGTNGSILQNTITFGFPFHMAILYGIRKENKNPISMINWKDVESAVLDGKSFAPYTKGQVSNPISPERVYAFRLLGKDNLVNITEIARQKLRELIKKQ